MTALDPQTQAWINSLKLNKSFKSTSDFENGYNFGVIFQKLQISKGKKFKNNSDLGCIFQNYKNVKDLLMQNFGYDFPANNIIYRTEELLKVLRDQSIKYTQRKKAATMKAATSMNTFGSMLQPQEQKMFKTREKQINTMLSNTKMNQTAKLPKKIQDIEKKLDKFREEKTRHQLLALEERKQQIDYHRRMVQDNRDYQINKIRRMHDTIKEQERKVYDVWMKTQQVKKNRIQTDKEFQRFQNQKKNKLAQTLRNQETQFIDKGLQMFQLNCIRQGIELEHDPDKPLKPEGQFNRVVIMERIKDNIKKHEHQKKERIKRQNKKRIDADDAKAKSQEVWTEIHKLQDYQKKFLEHSKMCEKTYAIEKRMKAEKQIRKQKCKEREFVDLPQIGDEETRKEEFRSRKIEYMFQEVERVEKRWNQNYSMAEEVVQALLQTTILAEDLYLKNDGFTYMEWKEIENVFMGFDGSSAVKKKKGKAKGKNTQYFIDFSTFNSILKQYLDGSGSWKNYHWEEREDQPHNQGLTHFVQKLIQRAYPDQPLPEDPGLPMHMPLKILINGARLAGKTSISAKISQKYGIPIINPVELLTQALELAKPPAEEDPKKAGKKDPKKAEEPTAQKIALKQYGEKLLQQQINTIQQVKIQNYIQIIKLRLTQLFTVKSEQQIEQQYIDAKKKQQERHEQALKDFEQGKNKPKKDSKKGAPANDAPEEPPKINQIFYTSGFIIDGFPITLENLKEIQKQMNAFISEDERVNSQAEEIKNKISMVLPIPQKIKDNRLKQGTFDIFAELSADKQSLLKRKDGRKMDPQTKIIYHSDFNPIPADVKGFADKLVDVPPVTEEEIEKSIQALKAEKEQIKNFYSVFGIETGRVQAYQQINQSQQNLNDTFQKSIEMIEKNLMARYAQIEAKIEQKQAEKRRKQQEEQKLKKIREQLGVKVQEKPSQKLQEKAQQNVNNEQNEQKKQDNSQQPQEGEQNKEQIVQKSQKQQKPSQSQHIIAPQQLTLQKIISFELNSFQCQEVLKKYLTNVETYEDSIKECLYNLDQERQNFSKQLFGVQRNFTNIINRPDDKAGKILGFQENYNKLLSEQSNIVKDAEASKHLIHRLDELYDSLWVAIGGKKDEAVQQRQRFMASDWLNQQALKIIEITRRLLQAELDYICETVFFILALICKYQSKSSDYMTEYLSLGIAPQLEPIDSISLDQLTRSDRLDYYLNQMDKCLSTLPQWIQQKHKKMKITRTKATDELLQKFINFSLSNIAKKKKNIRNKVIERLLEERSYYHTLINKMDEWIIQGIKSENDFVYQIYRNIRKSIEEAKRSNVKDLHVKQITQQFNPIKEITLNPIPLRVYTQHRKLPIFSYMIFLEQVKTLIIMGGNSKNRISFDTFKKYMDKRKKSKLLDPQILKIDYDTMEQYLVKDGIVNFRELAMATLLWDVKVFDDDALMKYRRKLLKEEAEQVIPIKMQKMEDQKQDQVKSNGESQQGQEQKEKEGQQQNKNDDTIEKAENEQRTPSARKQPSPIYQAQKRQSLLTLSPTVKKLSIDELVLMDGAFDEEEQYIMRHLIFEIFREDGCDYVEAQVLLDILAIFDQLQVQKYGDTLMMLGI